MDYLKGFLKDFPKLPEEIKNYLLSSDEKELAKKPFNRFKKYMLPANFVMNTEGGWITKDADWYLKITGSNKELPIKNRLTNTREYNYKYSLQAFKEGFVRVDWQQPISNQKFSVNPNHRRKLVFSFDALALKNQKMYWAINQIAIFYLIATPTPLILERHIIKYDRDKIEEDKKEFYGLNFFMLDLNSARNKAR